MNLNQAKSKVAQRLFALGLPLDIVNGTVDMTKEDSLITAAELINLKPDLSLEGISEFLYIPQL